MTQQGQAPLLVARGKAVGVLAIMDQLKSNAEAVVKKLQAQNKKVFLITGDKKGVGEALGEKLGVAEVLAEVLSRDKSEKIKELQKQGYVVAMVGDGVNDTPALAQADPGIALGSGTDVALETGEIVLVKSNLEDVREAIEISQYTLKKIKQNLF